MKRQLKNKEVDDLDLLPVMNLFSILIPFLLSVAVFQKMAVVEINMPERPSIETTALKEELHLNLSFVISKTDFQVFNFNGLVMQVPYQEIEKLFCQGSWVEKNECKNIAQGSQDFDLLAYKGGQHQLVWYQKGLPLQSHDGEFVRDKKILTTSKSIAGAMYNQSENSEFRPLSAFHFTEVFLRELKNQVADFEDSNDAVLVAGEEIKFDYIIKAMDALKSAGFANVSLARI